MNISDYLWLGGTIAFVIVAILGIFSDPFSE